MHGTIAYPLPARLAPSSAVDTRKTRGARVYMPGGHFHVEDLIRDPRVAFIVLQEYLAGPLAKDESIVLTGFRTSPVRSVLRS